jgi:predicted nuclease of restriction endonuclease-like (RecB) superfamily
MDKKTTIQSASYDTLAVGIRNLLDAARRQSARAVNAFMTATYWEIGRRIVEFEQGGKAKAEYGQSLLLRLAADLMAQFGRGFSPDNLESMRRFYVAYPLEKISETASRKLDPNAMTTRFPLPWSHYVRLLSVKNPETRRFYETEALSGGWSVRQLDRQISSLFYERTALSRNKAAMLTKGAKPRPEDAISTEEALKDPYVLEFLGLKDEYSESELEQALIAHLESFLLELGSGFAFIGRQR